MVHCNPSLYFLAHPLFPTSLTFDQKRLGRLNQRGGQKEPGGAKNHAGARKQGQVGQGARRDQKREPEKRELGSRELDRRKS